MRKTKAPHRQAFQMGRSGQAASALRRATSAS